MSTEVVMPQMGESIAEGTITKWLKKVGERVERDEPLFEISTDKVDAEIPSPAAGTLTEVRFKEGDTVEVNTVVAVLDGAGSGNGSVAPAGATASPAEPPAPVETKPEVAAPAPEPPAPAAATPPSAPAAATAPPASAKPTTSSPPAAETKAPTPTTSIAPQARASATVEELRRTKSSPLVRKIAKEHGVDVASLEGTGISGRVTKNDILSFIESGAVPAARSAA